MKMRDLAVRSIRANPVRFVATILAIVVGTSFLAGAMILRDTLVVALEANVTSQLKGVDAAVSGVALIDEEVLSGAAGGPGTTTPSSATGGSVPAVKPSGTTPSASGGAGPGPRRSRRERGGPGGQSSPNINQNVPATALPKIKQADGVGEAVGVLSSYVNILTAGGDSRADDLQGALWSGPSTLNPFRISSGQAPDQAGQIAIDAPTADQLGVQVGDTIDLGTLAGPQKATITGIVTYGEAARGSQNGDVLVNPANAFAWLNAGEQQYSTVYVAAKPGVTQGDLVRSITLAVGPQYLVQTGDELRKSTVGLFTGFVEVIGWVLIGFALLALFVSLFTIFNTFHITVTQRTREFALLRAIGAAGGQITSTVLTESVLLALFSSLLGIVVAAIAVSGLARLLPGVKQIAPSLGLRITPVTVVLVLLAGLIVTVASALIPAWRAARTRPIEALRSVEVDRSGTSKVRAVIGLVLLGFGIFLLLVGAVLQNFWFIAPAPPFLFFGVLVGGPVLATTFVGAVERIPGLAGHPARRIGVENVRRNPRRAALTAFALVIGVFLVSLVTAAGGAVRDYAVEQVEQFGGPDFMVFTATPTGFSDELLTRISTTPGVGDVGAGYTEVAVAGTAGIEIGAIDAARADVYGMKVERGKLSELGNDGIALPNFAAQQGRVSLGSPVSVTFENGDSRTFKLVAIIEPTATPLQAVISADAAKAADPALQPTLLAVKAQAGQQDKAEAGLTRLTRQFSGVALVPGNFLVGFVRTVFNVIIISVNVLLSVAVVIALFGVVNTLVLSVSERTREIGLLRAVGMTRRQVRSAIRLESIVVALLGSVVGMAFGLFMAWCLTRPILNQEGQAAAGFSWPVIQMVVVLVLALLLGVLASVVPAWRASRLNIIEAVTVD